MSDIIESEEQIIDSFMGKMYCKVGGTKTRTYTAIENTLIPADKPCLRIADGHGGYLPLTTQTSTNRGPVFNISGTTYYPSSHYTTTQSFTSTTPYRKGWYVVATNGVSTVSYTMEERSFSVNGKCSYLEKRSVSEIKDWYWKSTNVPTQFLPWKKVSDQSANWDTYTFNYTSDRISINKDNGWIPLGLVCGSKTFITSDLTLYGGKTFDEFKINDNKFYNNVYVYEVSSSSSASTKSGTWQSSSATTTFPIRHGDTEGVYTTRESFFSTYSMLRGICWVPSTSRKLYLSRNIISVSKTYSYLKVLTTGDSVLDVNGVVNAECDTTQNAFIVYYGYDMRSSVIPNMYANNKAYDIYFRGNVHFFNSSNSSTLLSKCYLSISFNGTQYWQSKIGTNACDTVLSSKETSFTTLNSDNRFNLIYGSENLTTLYRNSSLDEFDIRSITNLRKGIMVCDASFPITDTRSTTWRTSQFDAYVRTSNGIMFYQNSDSRSIFYKGSITNKCSEGGRWNWRGSQSNFVYFVPFAKSITLDCRDSTMQSLTKATTSNLNFVTLRSSTFPYTYTGIRTTTSGPTYLEG